MTKHKIIISMDTEEAEEFAAFLCEQGHDAEVGNSTGNYVDGESTSAEESANEIMNGLWTDYCNA